MGFYEQLQETVDRLLRDKGKTMVLTHAGTSTTCIGAEMAVKLSKSGIQGDDTMRQGSMVETKSRYVWLSPKDLSADPSTGDKLLMVGDSINWNVVGVTRYKPAGVVVAYKLTVMR